MSQWTHVAGIIRLDCLHAIVRATPEYKNKIMKQAVAKALGWCTNEDGMSECKDCKLPCGSEGSLIYRVSSNLEDPDNNALSWGYVSIWGDLRDFGLTDVGKIKSWFEQSINRLMKRESGEVGSMSMAEKAEYVLSSFSIRQAVLHIYVEYNPSIILLWDDKESLVRSYTWEIFEKPII